MSSTLVRRQQSPDHIMSVTLWWGVWSDVAKDEERRERLCANGQPEMTQTTSYRADQRGHSHMDMQPLTPRQKEVLDFISTWIGEHGYAPAIYEICKGLGLSSLATVHKHLENLKEKGVIRRGWNRSRFMELVWNSDVCPTCGRQREAKVS